MLMFKSGQGNERLTRGERGQLINTGGNGETAKVERTAFIEVGASPPTKTERTAYGTYRPWLQEVKKSKSCWSDGHCSLVNSDFSHL